MATKRKQPRRLKKKAIKKPVERTLSDSSEIASMSSISTSVDTIELPKSYNSTYITLIAKDPNWIYAYWEISPDAIDGLRKKSKGIPRNPSLTLRMYDVASVDFDGKNANHWFDVDIDQGSQNWYINIWNDNATYLAEIGLKTNDGAFLAAARSNIVTTPRASQSSRSDLIWMEVKDEGPKHPYVVTERKEVASLALSPKLGSRSWRWTMKLTDDDIREYYYNLMPRLQRLFSRRGKSHGFTLSSSIIPGLSKNQKYQKFRIGASEEMALQGGASEWVSSNIGDKTQAKDFFFEIGTELIVYGRTKPDAKVRLGGKDIPLREDGTFSLRFALPDGSIPLDFVAESACGQDQRAIRTAVERFRTHYIPS